MYMYVCMYSIYVCVYASIYMYSYKRPPYGVPSYLRLRGHGIEKGLHRQLDLDRVLLGQPFECAFGVHEPLAGGVRHVLRIRRRRPPLQQAVHRRRSMAEVGGIHRSCRYLCGKIDR